MSSLPRRRLEEDAECRRLQESVSVLVGPSSRHTREEIRRLVKSWGVKTTRATRTLPQQREALWAHLVQVGRSLHRGPPAVRGLIRVGPQRVQQVLNGLRDGRTRGMRLPHAGVSFTSSAKEVCLCFLWRKLWSEQCGEAGEEAAVKDASVEGQGSFLLRCARSCGRTALKTWPRGDAS